MKKMLRRFLIANCLTLALCASAIGAENADTQKYAPEDFRNYFGLAWNSTLTEILQYCKNVGHTCVMYKEGMERNPLSDGMTFVIETPEYAAYRRTIDLSKKYTKEEIAKIESLCAVAFPEKPFPQNMATGWFFNKNQVSMQLDMQQKAVHDIIIKRIFERVEKIEKRNPRFKFAGFSWDVPQPYGDFNIYVEKSKNRNRQTTLSHWTGFDGTPERAGIKHDYPTYFEGYFEFYRALMERARAKNPQAKFIVEPYDIYHDWIRHAESEFIKSKGADAKKYMPDFIWAEGRGTAFVNDARIFKSGLFTKRDVGNSCPAEFAEQKVRATASAAAKAGAWTAFFGRYGGYNTAPYAKSIRDIAARVKLAKLIPVWENLNNTPLSERNLENGVYQSPTAHMSADAYSAVRPQGDGMFFVFITDNGSVKIPQGKKLDKVVYLDGIFGECGVVPKGILKNADGAIYPITGGLAGQALFAKFKR